MTKQKNKNPEEQRGARESDSMHSGDKSHLKGLGSLTETLSNDQNGFSNAEGFNTDEGHHSLAGSGGSGTSDMMSLDNDTDMDQEFNTTSNSDSGIKDNSEIENEERFRANDRNQDDSGNAFSRGND